jgi:nucleoside-diphosphate-sugar epimerase
MEALLEQARSAGVESFVHVSSVGVYGNLGKMAADEKTPCRPQSIYGETKLAGEKKVFQFAGRTGFPIVVLRPAWVYGSHCPRTLKLYKKIKRKRMVVIGAGENLRHPLYVEDFCRAVELAMQRKDGLFLIAGPEVLTSRQLLEGFAKALNLTPPKLHFPYNAALIIATVAEKVFGILGKEPPASRRSLEFFDTDNAFDTSKARRELLFEPIYDLMAGLNHCRAWLEEETQETVARLPRPWGHSMTIQNTKRFF